MIGSGSGGGRGRRVPLARSMLVHRTGRLAAALLGVSVAVAVMFAELGFLGGVHDSLVLPIRALDGDLVIASRLKDDMNIEKPFPRSRLAQARGVTGVESVTPVYLQSGQWRTPGGPPADLMRVFAVDPDDPGLLPPGLGREQARRALQRPEAVLADRLGRAHFAGMHVGRRGELDGRRAEVVGTFALGPDLQMNGSLILGMQELARRYPSPDGGDRLDRVEFGVVRLQPRAAPEAVASALADALPGDVVVQPPGRLAQRIQWFWLRNQPVGAVFTIGLAVGCAIGTLICYQVLFNLISDQLRELATLKAIGHGNGYLRRVALSQGLLLGVGSFALGLLWSVAGYGLLQRLTGLTMDLTAARVGIIALLTVTMCLLAARIAVVRVERADPAELF
ncbi:MAG: hypothetical protein DWQ36_24485 [Acidobacteria bacterium]|nr:MAG: hypothetical protein DWQ30_07680 [Acidobacteriota bacterium]REK00305.1 MAG: hypothetical protein DWQ36_24485 [Acidobacteriota bacterium]